MSDSEKEENDEADEESKMANTPMETSTPASPADLALTTGRQTVNNVNSQRATGRSKMTEEQMLKREMEIEQTEKLRFTRMQKMNEHKIRDIMKISPDKRDSGQNFYLRMHLQQNVPFFANYSGETLANICNELH